MGAGHKSAPIFFTNSICHPINIQLAIPKTNITHHPPNIT